MKEMSRLKHYISQAPDHSGVYRFYDINDKILYIGKAKSLYKRLQSYMRDNLSIHIQEMVLHAVKVTWILTSNEMEALFLEAELIEKIYPMYNIQHINGRNYTYIQLSKSEYPRLTYSRYWSEQSYGPFLSSDQVRNTIDGLYGVFKLRSCTDAFFKARKKPCMEYDLGRCSAPCVGVISKEEYNLQVLNLNQLFTTGDNKIIDLWNTQLDTAIEEEQYELAATLNKRVQSLTMIRNNLLDKTNIETATFFISSVYQHMKCVHICSIKNFIIRHKILIFTSSDEDMLDFIARWSVKNQISEHIFMNEKIDQEYKALIQSKLSDTQNAGVKKYNMKLLTDKIYPNIHKTEEAGLKCARDEVDSSTKYKTFAARLGVKAINRVEVYDNSHMGGKWNVGVKIVWTPNGFKHNDYQVFYYAYDTHDDYAMMRELFQRRFCKFNNYNQEEKTLSDICTDTISSLIIHPIVLTDIANLVKEKVQSEAAVHQSQSKTSRDMMEMPWPDLVIIDGGAGQLSVASKYIPVQHYALSKHEEGDQLHAIEQGEFKIVNIDSDLRLWLMKIRDEAHRFAVQSHSKVKEGTIPIGE